MTGRLRRPGGAILFACVTLVACRTFAGGGSATPDRAVRRAELFETHRLAAQRAASSDFVGALSEVFATQGFFVGAITEPGRGPEAARAFLRRDTLNEKSRGLWRILRFDVSADGRDGYTYGYLDVIRPTGDTVPGGFQAYWRRGNDGAWKVLAMGRQRRDKGPTEALPASVADFPITYRSWPMSDSVAAFDTLKATEVAFSDSAATNVRAAFMSFAAPDAAKINGARYGFGPEAIGEAFRNPPALFNGIKWYAEVGTVAGSNDLGFDVGPVARRPTPGSPGGERVGSFFTIWRRQPNGQWRYLVD